MLIAALNANPELVRHFPSTLSRMQGDAGIALLATQLAKRGWGCWAAELRQAGESTPAMTTGGLGGTGMLACRRHLP